MHVKVLMPSIHEPAGAAAQLPGQSSISAKTLLFKLTIQIQLPCLTLSIRDSVENKPASLLVVPLGRALSGITSSWCGRQKAGNS